MTHVYSLELSRQNKREKYDMTYNNYILLDTDVQNNLIIMPVYKNAQNNTTAIPCYVKLKWTYIEHKIKELLKFEY